MLAFIFFAIGMIFYEVSDKYRDAFEHSLLIKDIKSPIEILNDSVNSDNRCFDFDYFDDNNILQSKSFIVDKIYTHKKDYYKIVGKFDEDKNDYHFYLYEPYWPIFWSNSDKTDNKKITHTNNVTININ